MTSSGGIFVIDLIDDWDGISSLGQNGAGIFWIHRQTTSQGGDTAEPLVRSNKQFDTTELAELEKYGQLQSIECPKTLGYSEPEQQSPCIVKVILVKGRRDK